MRKLLRKVDYLKNRGTRKIINHKIREFSVLGKKQGREIFKELCFCILTANYNAEKSIRIQEEIGDGFLELSEQKLAHALKERGYRYPNTRAKYIVEARKYKDNIKDIIKSFSDENELREWIVKNIKGLGYKEASHFLRNIGFKDCAIIDFHIIDVLAEHGLIEKPKNKSPNKKTYLEVEEKLRKLGNKLDLTQAELDLYLWYMETGKVLK